MWIFKRRKTEPKTIETPVTDPWVYIRNSESGLVVSMWNPNVQYFPGGFTYSNVLDVEEMKLSQFLQLLARESKLSLHVDSAVPKSVSLKRQRK